MNRILFFIFTSILSFQVQADSLPVSDQDFACITQEKANQYVRDYNIDVASFGGMELCDSKIDTKKLFNDLLLIEAGQFSADTNNSLIKGFLPAKQYYSWMKGQTRGIERGQDIPFATAYNSGGYFTMQDGWAELSTLGRVGTVIHEARHTAGYRHIACNMGPYLGTGVPGCDPEYSYAGSHAIEMEYYARVTIQGQNFHPVYQKMARLMAMGRANFVFNQNPLKQKETLLALGKSGQAYVWNGQTWLSRETPEIQGRLKRTSFGAAIMNDRNVMAIDPFQNSGVRFNVVDDYSYFKLFKADRGLGEGALADAEEFDLGRKRYFAALKTNEQIGTYNYKEGKWNRLSTAPRGVVRFSTWAPSAQPGLFLVDESLRVYSVNPENPSQISLTNEKWASDTKSYVKLPNAFYALKSNGALVELKGEASTSVLVPEALDQIVAVPVYDSFEVQP